MERNSDVIVIGAGIVGCSAAYYLAKRGVKVIVLEADEIAYGASGRNGSGVRQSSRDNRELPLTMYGVKNIWPNLKEELGIDIEYIQNGNMRMGKTEEDIERLKKIVENNRACGLELDLLFEEDVKELNPYVADDVCCCTWCPTDGHANPMRTTLGFYRRAKQLGAKFVIGEKVISLQKHCGKIRKVITDQGEYEADTVILTAGYDSRRIMRTVGIDVPMLPKYTEAVITEALPPMFDMFLGTAGGVFYAQQQLNGTFLVGGDSDYELFDANYDRNITFSFSAPRICRFFLDYIPSMKNAKVIRSWSGQLSMCVDKVAVISPVEEVPGLLLGCAFTGHGFGIGPAAGYSLACMALNEPTPVDLTSLRYDRFRVPSAM